jgi:hypothetical protein
MFDIGGAKLLISTAELGTNPQVNTLYIKLLWIQL